MKTGALIIGIVAAISVGVGVAIFGLSSQSDITESTSIPDNADTIIVEPTKLTVYASFFPIYEFTKGVAGDYADVELLIPSNVEPHDYEITPQTLVDLKSADVLVYNGAEFEPFVEQIIDSGEFNHLVFVDTTEGIELLSPTEEHDEHDEHEGEHGDSHAEEFTEEIAEVIEEFEEGHMTESQTIVAIEEILHEHEGDGHDHGEGIIEDIEKLLHEIEDGHIEGPHGIEEIHHLVSGEDVHDEDHEKEDEHEEHDGHGHGSFQYDPHVWLDPVLAKQQVLTIGDGLLNAANSPLGLKFEENAISYAEKLDALDANIREELSTCKKDTFVPFHNAFTYFAERYDLHAESLVGLSPHSNPSPAEIEEMIHFAEEHDIKYFFHEEFVDTKVSDVLADELGGGILIFSPLEGLTDDDIANKRTSYFDKMNYNIEQLKIALEC